jgi:hypothetical protein
VRHTKHKSAGPVNTSSLLTVADGRETIGFILRRARGAEAFTTDEISIGLFDSVDAAAKAVWRSTHPGAAR